MLLLLVVVFPLLVTSYLFVVLWLLGVPDMVACVSVQAEREEASDILSVACSL